MLKVENHLLMRHMGIEEMRAVGSESEAQVKTDGLLLCC
jgi:hypothetical protein